jgi:hypothetical protein
MTQSLMRLSASITPPGNSEVVVTTKSMSLVRGLKSPPASEP